MNPFNPKEDIDNLKISVDKMNTLLFAVVVILLFMVGNMLIDSWNNKSANLENLQYQINQENVQLQRLNDSLSKTK